ncbi:acyltransferase-domain-containing protein [Corynespora cassiicola Philippines]|uniref:Acyltransferase-domain-containing protein n=1 Tax=Corynespora cassiicola Philippines TaxID=1448308 RepID=A0A2T2N3W4_CORCC|nr:acyltransferase-domain-containing protein [Corynespora cassiicola Philippines]
MSWLLYAMAGPPLIILFLRGLSAVLPRKLGDTLAFAAFSLTSVIMLCVCASYGVVASIALRVVGYGGLSQWTVARAFKWTMWLSTGVTFRVNDSGRIEGGRRGGEEALLTRPAVFVGNHQTELDVLMLGCIFPKYTSVTAKKSLKFVPFLGWFSACSSPLPNRAPKLTLPFPVALSKTVFIDRANRATARAAFDSAAQTMRTERQSVFIFPEGTRSYTDKPELLPFKKGAFHLAVQAQVPIVPLVSANYAHVLDVKNRRFTPGVIDVSVLPAIPTKGLTAADVDGLVQRTQDAMLAELVRLSHVTGTGNGVPLPRASGVEKEGAELRKRI